MTTRFSMRKAAGSRSISAPTLLNGAISISVIWSGLARIVFAIHAIASVFAWSRSRKTTGPRCLGKYIARLGRKLRQRREYFAVLSRTEDPPLTVRANAVLPHAVVTPNSFSSGLVNTRPSAYASSMSSPISVSRITFCGASGCFCARAYLEPAASRQMTIITKHFKRICSHSRAEHRFQPPLPFAVRSR